MNHSIMTILGLLMVSSSLHGMLDPNQLWYAAVGMTYADWCKQKTQDRDHKERIVGDNQSVKKEVKPMMSTRQTAKDDKHA